MTIAAERWTATWRAAIDDALALALRERCADAPERLAEAMRYAALSGGKRLRPLLALATAAELGAEERAALPSGVALELIHAYSLVHDDLPAMDDDALRRGRATVHVEYDEATAILVGDALQSLAFEVLAEEAEPARAARQLAVLARAAGAAGMAGGQALDLEAEGRGAEIAPGRPGVAEVERIHALKTGALIAAAFRLGAEAAGAPSPVACRLERIGGRVGLAFQIRDDTLDATATTGRLGKTAGKDIEAGKATWPAAAGLDAARRRAGALVDDALRELGELGFGGGPLVALVRRAVDRER